MPSPIAHSISGYVIFRLFSIKNKAFKFSDKGIYQLFPILFTVFVANAADLDFILQSLTGNKFHRGLTHSLTFALLFSLLVALITRFSSKKINICKQIFWLCLLLYGSHLLLDFLTSGGNGMQILWPFSNNYYKSPISIFPPVHHELGLFAPIHIIFISFELTYALTIYYLLDIWKKYQVKKAKKQAQTFN